MSFENTYVNGSKVLRLLKYWNGFDPGEVVNPSTVIADMLIDRGIAEEVKAITAPPMDKALSGNKTCNSKIRKK